MGLGFQKRKWLGTSGELFKMKINRFPPDTFRFFEKFPKNSKFTRFQRICFDFLSNPGLWLLRKSKEILWKRVNFENFENFPKFSKYLKWKLVFYHHKQLLRGPQPLYFLKTQPHSLFSNLLSAGDSYGSDKIDR